MASMLLIRQRIQPKDHRETDVLAIEKAAAWVWHQRSSSSGSEGKIMREFHTTRTHQRDHQPSRYKLEAMKMASSSSQETLVDDDERAKKKLPLLDAYEVRSILTRLDNLVAESNHDKPCSLNDKTNMGRRMKKKVGKGIWEGRRVMCSARKEDVVDGRRGFKGCQIQLSAMCVPATKRSIPQELMVLVLCNNLPPPPQSVIVK
ncbi:uncharacterized protein LOC129304241 [Prosopis cineraria]|uniref:uncharacterized protein LOC129304241 n=1 Tax=Prosopis cineraria TaxID=364024 RepID=UPI00241063AD|nr:uncharacterized protein LOC129304241 [Prosopis cineraria]